MAKVVRVRVSPSAPFESSEVKVLSSMITIKKGIELPISGGLSDTTVHDFIPKNAKVGIIGDDYVGLKPTMLVTEGDIVQQGQALFEDKKNAGVFVTAPVAGRVSSIVRGERRRFISLIIEPDFQAEAPKHQAYGSNGVSALTREVVVDTLAKNGLWVCLRQRPFDKTPALEALPQSIFVNTMDSNPLAFDPTLALVGREDDYQVGLQVLSRLADVKIHICKKAGKKLPHSPLKNVQEHEFAGIHPAGLVGTHIHFIDPVGAQKSVWHINLQDLLMWGKFFREGILDTRKLVAVAGPSVDNPRLYRTLRGISLEALLQGHMQAGEQRVISGSVFSGRQAEGDAAYLSAYDQQVSVLAEGRETYFLRFFMPGKRFYSKTRAFLGRFCPKNCHSLLINTSSHGSPRPIVPFGIYEDVMPLDILPTLLLKALIVQDTDTAISLGALELVEEDVALLSFVDSGKHDFGAILRENLTLIEQEG